MKWSAILLLLAFAPAVADDRPNILLLVAEDLSPRIGSFGDAVAQTPNIDALAEAGVRYTRVHTTAGVCAPSRAALITGMHQISIGAQHMRTSDLDYRAVPPPQVKAFPELLRAAGYYTFTDGKLDYQFSGVSAGSGPFTIWDDEGEDADWRGRQPGQPFFGMINFAETHESRLRRHWRESGNDVPATVTDPADVTLPPYYPDLPVVRRDLARHYDNIHYMDAKVGELLARLDADGLTGETIVIFTTDHGDALPRAKREIYVSGIAVPMVVRIPDDFVPDGWQPGSADARLVSFVDLAPSILALAGVLPLEDMHGRNFLEARRRYVYASRDRIDEVDDRQRAIRDERYQYIRSWYPDVPGGHELAYRDDIEFVPLMRDMYRRGELDSAQAKWFEAPGAEQLYDLSEDPYELHNLAGSAAHETTLRRMRAALDEWLDRVGDWSDEPEEQMRGRFLAPDGQARQTEAPTLERDGETIHISAADGASIGYRVDGGAWRLYTAPLEGVDGVLEAKAVRYGWRESAIARLPAQ